MMGNGPKVTHVLTRRCLSAEVFKIVADIRSRSKILMIGTFC